jgi:hypothetical protein
VLFSSAHLVQTDRHHPPDATRLRCLLAQLVNCVLAEGEEIVTRSDT